MSGLSEALLSLRPGAEFYVKDSKLTWLDSKQTEPTQEEIDAEIVRLKKEWENKQYQRDRQLEYPNTNDLIVALWEKVVEGRSESADALEVKRQEVKTVHPKPE